MRTRFKDAGHLIPLFLVLCAGFLVFFLLRHVLTGV